MKQRIVVSGAAGFVGRNLLPLLVINGYEVLAIVKNQAEKKAVKKYGIKIIVGDLAKDGEWTKSLKNSDVLVHLASAISSKDSSFFERNNVVATRNIIKAAKRTKITKIIHFSSAAVTSIRQDDYARTKKEQEKIVMDSGIPFFVLRPSMIYGPTDDKNVGWLINTVKKLPMIPLPGGGNFGRQPVYVEDICKVVLKLIENAGVNKLYEIHGYEYVTMKQMVKAILKQFNFKRIVIPIPVILLKLAIVANQLISKNPKFTLDQVESLVSGEKFKGDNWSKLFDIIPTKFSEGIKKM